MDFEGNLSIHFLGPGKYARPVFATSWFGYLLG
jgi:hypothetical protein